MRRLTRTLLSFAPVLLLPLAAHAAPSILTPISLAQCNCVGTAPDWGCVLQILQIVINDLIALGVIVITIFIAWAGFAYLTAPISAQGRLKGRQRVVNAVIGLLIMLCAWLLINSLLFVIYNASATSNGVTLTQWYSLLSDSNQADNCIITRTSQGSPNSGTVAPVAPTPATGSSAVGNAQCPGNLICSTSGQCTADPQLDNGNGAAGAACNSTSPNCQSGLVCDNTGVCSASGTSSASIPASCTYVAASSGTCTAPSAGACSPSALQNTCFASRAQQASEICNQESAGGNTSIESGTDRLNGGSGSSYSVGLWQINLTTTQVGGLNCPSAFSGTCAGSNLVGSSHPGWCYSTITNQALYNQCVTAAQNATNNTQAACGLYGSSQTFQPWSYSANLCSIPKTQ